RGVPSRARRRPHDRRAVPGGGVEARGARMDLGEVVPAATGTQIDLVSLSRTQRSGIVRSRTFRARGSGAGIGTTCTGTFAYRATWFASSPFSTRSHRFASVI